MKIGNFNLEKDGTYIIAELSANHNEVLQNALDTIKAVKDIGVNCIKLQTYTPDTMDKKEFADMIKDIRDTEKLLGKIDYTMTEKKKKSRQFSRSLYLAKDIKKGEVFSEENIRSVRPKYGMHPKYLKNFLGKVADKEYAFFERFEG